MNGIIKFLDSELYFSFDGNTLEIYCVNGQAKTLLFEKKSNGVYASTKNVIPSGRLEGRSFDLKSDVVFYIDQQGYGYNGDLQAEKVILKINVLKYIVTKSKKCDRNVLVLGSKQFSKFLYLFPEYKLVFEKGDKIADVTYQSVVSSDVAEFTFRGKRFKAYPAPSISSNFIKFDFSPEINVVCDEFLTENEVLSLVEVFYKIVAFLFMRENIVPDYICYYSKNLKHSIYYRKSSDYFEEIEDDKNFFDKIGFIRWSAICKNFQNIIDDFDNKNVNIKHIGPSLESRKWYDLKKISTIASFFEFAYSIIYTNKPSHRTSSQHTIDTITNALLPLKKEGNRKIRETVDFLIQQLDHVSLETKIRKVFNDYSKCLGKVKSEFGLGKYKASEIAGICAQTRNWTDHGDSRAEITLFIASCFAYLTCAAYAMYLKRWGIGDQLISDLLVELYKI